MLQLFSLTFWPNFLLFAFNFLVGKVRQRDAGLSTIVGICGLFISDVSIAANKICLVGTVKLFVTISMRCIVL